MKKIFLFAAAAFMAACSSDDLTVDNQKQAQLEEGAVGFDAYMQRATTRSGLAEADLAIGNLASNGFGVFGYYTDNKDYDQLALPNFMYNEKVYSVNASAPYTWKYDVLKYWPNEYGYNAISDDADKVTFFAYAPYEAVTPSTGKVADDTWGITGITRNSNAGDPIVKYIASFANKYAVDLCWAVCQQNDWQLVETGQTQAFTPGKPWLNVQRPGAVDQKLKFQFKHATAKLQIYINEFNDGYQPATGDLNDIPKTQTRIWIRSVRFTGFTMQGALNLNNETANEPYWMNYSGLGDLSVTDDVVVYDQRKDGKEGVAGAVATNEKVGGLNPSYIQVDGLVESNMWKTGSAPRGVTRGLGNLFDTKGGSNDWFYVIPSGDDMEIEIVYDVETISKDLYNTISDGTTKGSSIENRITKKIKFGDNNAKLEAGKAYDIKLHIGMNDVDFDADVVDWDKMPTPDIDLPANMPAYAIGTTAGNIGTIEIPGAAEGFDFAVTGLKGGQNVTNVASTVGSTATWGSTSGSTNKNVNASGVLYVNVASIAAGDQNTTIVDKETENAITITTSQDGTQKLTVIQKAEALKLKAPASPAVGNTFALERTGIGAWTTDNTNCPALTAYPGTSNNNYIRVWRNGTELSLGGSGAAGFTFNNTTGTITLGTDAKSKEVIKVTIKASTVAEETVTFSLP